MHIEGESGLTGQRGYFGQGDRATEAPGVRFVLTPIWVS